MPTISVFPRVDGDAFELPVPYVAGYGLSASRRHEIAAEDAWLRAERQRAAYELVQPAAPLQPACVEPKKLELGLGLPKKTSRFFRQLVELYQRALWGR